MVQTSERFHFKFANRNLNSLFFEEKIAFFNGKVLELVIIGQAVASLRSGQRNSNIQIQTSL
jgi:hypothetical protein